MYKKYTSVYYTHLGIEIVEEAVNDAKENAINNDIKNVEFIAGDVENVLDELINIKDIIPDVIMVDPPRKGLDNKSIDNIMNIHPKKIVYISCNPATLIRDLAKFEDLYLSLIHIFFSMCINGICFNCYVCNKCISNFSSTCNGCINDICSKISWRK